MYAGFEHTYVYKTITNENIVNTTNKFKLSIENYRKLKELDNVSTPFDNSAYRETTFLMAYSRKTTQPLDRTFSEEPTPERKERWFDVVVRVIEGTMTFYVEHMKRNCLNLNNAYLNDLSYRMAESFYKMHWIPPGRGLFAMGSEHTYRIGCASLNNCYAVDVEKNLTKACVWSMDMLMCGGGVGYSTKWNSKIVRPNKEDYTDVVVPDSREGWCIALEMLMRSYIPDKQGKVGKFPKFDYSVIRPYGSPIRGFGGTASGPEPLRILLERVEVFLDTYLNFNMIDYGLDIHEKNLKLAKLELLTQSQRDTVKHSHITYLAMFEEMVSRNIYQDTDFDYNGIRNATLEHADDEKAVYSSTRLVADIVNSIGVCVVSGNVRRSSQILLGDPDDPVFIHLKNYTLHPLRRPFMYLSNNTVRLWDNDQFDKYLPTIAERMRDNGEPGVLNMINIRKYGRFSDSTYGEDTATLVNPCGEITLNSYEPCCLSVVAPTKCLDQYGNYDQKLVDLAMTYATIYAMIVTTIPHHWSVTNKIIHANRRIGVGMTGIIDFYEKYGTTKTISLCKKNYKTVREINKTYSAKMGIRQSIRCTTSKPDGTIGIVLGVSSGINFPNCRYAKRRICYDKSNALLKTIEKAGYEIEPSTLNSKHSYAIFPICETKSRTERDASIFEKLALVELIQRHYVDNSVSVTIAFNPGTEASLVEKAISMHIPQLKSLSTFPQYDVLPEQFKHLPFENIDEVKYQQMLSMTTPLDQKELYQLPDADDNVTSGCTGGICSIKLSAS